MSQIDHEKHFFGALLGDLDSLKQYCESFDDFLWASLFSNSIRRHSNQLCAHLEMRDSLNFAISNSLVEFDKHSQLIWTIILAEIKKEQYFLAQPEIIKFIAQNPSLCRIFIHLHLHKSIHCPVFI